MKYEIELSESQYAMLIESIEVYARSIMGQADIVADILADTVFKYDKDDENNDARFNDWINKRRSFAKVLDAGFEIMFGENHYRSEKADNLIDMWRVLRHQEWQETHDDNDTSWDVRSSNPFQMGTEELMKIKKIEEG